MNCPTPDSTTNSQADSRPTTTPSFFLFRPLAWLTAHKSVCLLFILLGLTGLGLLNNDLLAETYIAAVSNPHEETAKLFPADTTLMYISVNNIGALLREDEKIDAIVEAQIGDIKDLKEETQKTLDEITEEIFGQKIATREDLESLGLLNGSAAVGFFHTRNMNFQGVVVLQSTKAEALAQKILAARKKEYEQWKESEEYQKNFDCKHITVSEEVIEYGGAKIRILQYKESPARQRVKR